jgi:hypothetical protein
MDFCEFGFVRHRGLEQPESIRWQMTESVGGMGGLDADVVPMDKTAELGAGELADHGAWHEPDSGSRDAEPCPFTGFRQCARVMVGGSTFVFAIGNDRLAPVGAVCPISLHVGLEHQGAGGLGWIEMDPEVKLVAILDGQRGFQSRDVLDEVWGFLSARVGAGLDGAGRAVNRGPADRWMPVQARFRRGSAHRRDPWKQAGLSVR